LSFSVSLLIIGKDYREQREPCQQEKRHFPLTGCVFSLPGVFLAPVVGALADLFGRKRILVPSMMLFGVPGGASVRVLFFLCRFPSDFFLVS